MFGIELDTDIAFLKRIKDGEWYSMEDTTKSRKAFSRMIRKWEPLLEVRKGMRGKVYIRVRHTYLMSLNVVLRAWEE